MDQSPAGGVGKGRGKGQRKPRKPKAAPGPMHVNPMSMGQSPMGQGTPGLPMAVQGGNPQMGHGMAGYGPTGGMQQQAGQYGGNANQQGWYSQQQQQPGYYPPMAGKLIPPKNLPYLLIWDNSN